MKGFRTGYVRSFTEDYKQQEERNRLERIEAYRQRIAEGLPIFEDDLEPQEIPAEEMESFALEV